MFFIPVSLLASASLTMAAKAGYFDTKVCVDPAGMEECYKTEEAQWADCIASNCEGQNSDCHNICSCIRTESEINCAATHCWNQVYSCEYQETAGEIARWCLQPDFSDVPFFPPPDDAPGACSCNQAKLLTYLHQSTEEIDTCGRKGMKLAEESMTIDNMELFKTACICCSKSAQLSAFYDICPDTNPSLLGFDEFSEALTRLTDDWSSCGNAMAQISCGKDGFDFTPPGGDSSGGHFYEPDNFPASGTESLSNMPGTITAPISGETFTWTARKITHVVTVASADARPTGQPGGNSSGDRKDEDKGGKSETNDGDNSNDGDGQNEGGSNNGNDSQNEESNEEDESAAPNLIPKALMICISLFMALA